MNEFRTEGEVVWIKLTQGKETRIDADMWPWVSSFSWIATKINNKWYAQARVNGKVEYLHRLIKSGFKIDHKDGDGLNNLENNLRSATHSQNLCNRGPQRNNTSGFKGVSWNKGTKSWDARITARGKQLCLGRFDSAEEAAKAYNNQAKRLHGKFAFLNTI